MTKKNNNKITTTGATSSTTKGKFLTVRRQNYGVGGQKEILSPSRGRQITTTPNGIRVRYMESMTVVYSETTNTFKGYELFGGTFANTPWLSGIAKNYSKFKFHSIKCSYSSACPTSQTGELALAWVPDVNDASSWSISGSLSTIYNYSKWVAGPCYGGTVGFTDNTMSVTITNREIHNSMPWFYVGQSGEILAHYGGALIYQAGPHSAGPGLKLCGRIYFEYDIEFCQPQSPLDLAFAVTELPSQSGGHWIPSGPLPPGPSDPTSLPSPETEEISSPPSQPIDIPSLRCQC